MSADRIEKWFVEYEKDVTNYLVYYTGSADVEDLVQDTFLNAFRSINQFRHEANPKTWLISIARHTAIDYHRKKSVWLKLKQKLTNESIRMTGIQTEELLLRKIDSAKLYDAINQLKTNYRDVVILRGISELSAKETAEVLGWNENKVNVTFYRAAKKLNEQLKEGEAFEQCI